MVLYGVGISVNKMLKFYVKVFYVIGKALSGELSFTGAGLVLTVELQWLEH